MSRFRNTLHRNNQKETETLRPAAWQGVTLPAALRAISSGFKLLAIHQEVSVNAQGPPVLMAGRRFLLECLPDGVGTIGAWLVLAVRPPSLPVG